MKLANITKIVAAIALVAATIINSGCVRSVRPVTFEVAENNETMFVVPLVGENKDSQVKFNSIEYFNSPHVKVALRQIQDEYMWVNTGRFEWMNNGEWRKVNRVIKVNRSPVNVKLVVDDAKNAKKDPDAIWIESRDSIGFSVGVVMTAFIKEEDAAKFLYSYKGDNLNHVLINEVRNSVAEVMANFATQYKLDDLRAHKQEMMEAVRNHVIPFYANKGITIQTIAQFGGITYENEKIQEAIDKVFIAEQEKNSAAATLSAVADINRRTEALAKQASENAKLTAQGEAEAIRLKAEAVAKGELMKKEADAKGINLVNAALEAASKNPMYALNKQLDNEAVLYSRWTGNVPQTVIGDTKGMSVIIGGFAKDQSIVPVAK